MQNGTGFSLSSPPAEAGATENKGLSLRRAGKRVVFRSPSLLPLEPTFVLSIVGIQPGD